MLRATGGVNTHKGAIFSMGLLAAAAGRLYRLSSLSAEVVLSECRAMTEGLTARDFAGLSPENAQTAGQRLYTAYGVTGVRGEAERGFPLVSQVGLPRLREALSAGCSINDAGCAALIALMAENTDTNVLHRSSLEAQRDLSARAAALLHGNPFPGREALSSMDADLIRQNISPGGSADLLALCFFLYFLEEAD